MIRNMENSSKKPKNSSKIVTGEDFCREFDKELEKRGLLKYLVKTPFQPTDEYEVVFRPYEKKIAKSLQEQKKEKSTDLSMP